MKTHFHPSSVRQQRLCAHRFHDSCSAGGGQTASFSSFYLSMFFFSSVRPRVAKCFLAYYNLLVFTSEAEKQVWQIGWGLATILLSRTWSD